MTMEEKLKRIDEIADLMREKIPVEEHIALYEEAMDLRRECQKELALVEAMIKRISQKTIETY